MKVRILPRRRGVAAVVAVAFALTMLSGCSADETVELDLPAQVESDLPADTVAQLEAAVTSAMTATGSSGAVVGVWAPWSGQWVTGLGAQSIGGTDAVTTDMTFRAGDVTRAMTCDVLFRTAAAGTVSLDDSVTQYVSSVPDLSLVSLRQLCDSSSGVGSYAPTLQSAFFSNPDREWNPRELAGYGQAQYDQSVSGSAFRDSDAGYLLLGLALERATGESIGQLIDEEVVRPLGLTATSLPGSDPAPPGDDALEGYWSVPDAAGAWNCADPANRTVLSASMGASDSGAVTDITDLGRYAQALATNALVGGESARFDNPLPVAADQPSWFTAKGGAYQAGSLIGQYGSVPGYLTAAFSDPTTGMTVAVVLNNSGANSSIGAWLAWELAAIASKAPAASGQTAPQAGLPWTAQQFHDQIAANAICAAPAP
ncbi:MULTISPECIES: serine hydrolase domain-containing protein [unclassified Microbacterium]|uniref:serine hydrolase domain-containing protein n=1 Tax=unclassified Microbacterium TaxID=2609290 RepID=UPI0037474190